LGVIQKGLDILAGDFFKAGLFFDGLGYDLVIDIGDILYVCNFIATILEIASQDIEEDEGAGVSDVEIVIDSGPAGIDLYLSRRDGNEFLFFPLALIV
jgi:hypothetical protein